ncbi:hypothetical protein GQF61_11855 [Sphingobacterium sp. DK4209]|uniref:Uncharacterized protein n=1 Tax=Sphingobacterium zhuxiongii TaxID=2662364 RepID=A0A5Q0QFN1_9SPHI|nr:MULTISPECIES: hypothetical protein [unclassified Sphingobacterium]MVZ66556.1 hypothetical protein [Sphingobacterium sp. DK4209]QGA27791.1 hypothetical protein GFH32_16335 [Sphingobacterium sp. dk4302]
MKNLLYSLPIFLMFLFHVNHLKAQEAENSSKDDEVQMEENCNKFLISDNNEMLLVARIRCDYRIVGYSSPSLKSKPLILFSVFTKDVESKTQLPLGNYYATTGLEDGSIYYVKTRGNYIQARYISTAEQKTVYFEKKYVDLKRD